METLKNEVREMKRLIKINNILLEENQQESEQFEMNCTRINNLLNGSKYSEKFN